MSRKITINKIVTFEPDKKIISGKKNAIRLSASATLCLELLIDNLGVLVTHQQLYDFAWRRFGMEPTATSLYQNISNLRRALNSTGLKEEIIRTMPRRGFILSPLTDIHYERKPPVDTDNQTPGDTDINVNIEEKLSPDEEGTKISAKDDGFLRRYVLSLFKKNFYFCTACFLLTVLVGGGMIRQQSADERVLYRPIKLKFRECYAYTNADNSMDDAKLEKIMESSRLNCKKKKFLYVTTYKKSERSSILLCQNAIGLNQRANCNSYYYIEHI
ncbi:transcriptional regulator [Lonsdalea quercina]|uniref:winged helix-turn-helix domain-containing protein n=1 Tax=Lonsdalea quercina TaxID=71657 RepID=UPI00397625F7